MMKIAVGQIKSFLGDFKESGRKIQILVKKAKGAADILVLPEGGIFGYPPTDFINQPRFLKKQIRILNEIHKNIPSSLSLLTGIFISTKEGLKNGAVLFQKNQPPKFFFKESLPDQDVFYESRYFVPGKISDNFFILKNKRVQVLICEDMWRHPKMEKPDLLICLNSSPYTTEKHSKRMQSLKQLVRKYQAPGVYVNRVGGQDELLFDGGSFCLNSKGGLSLQCAFFEEDFKIGDPNRKTLPFKKPSHLQQGEKALIMGVRDFCLQTGFKKAHLGLSGGIDSALVCYLAVKALGPENVTGIFLPGPYTAPKSFQIVQNLKKTLGFSLKELSIDSLYGKTLKELFPLKSPLSLTAQNLLSRLRMLCLMSYSNEQKSLLLGTGNKSELACGYATLYGDLSGGLMVIGDLFKTEVYKLCKKINKTRSVFLKSLLTRPPSAELKPNQTDQDDLPDYKDLDPILKYLMNHNPPRSPLEKQIEKLLRKSEFKRKQSPPVLKISERSFGRGWRFPIAHKFYR